MIKYIKKDIEFNELISIIMISCIIGFPILFFPKFISAIWFIFWIGGSMFKLESYKEEEK